MLIVYGDMPYHGNSWRAGALAFGIGVSATEIAHVLATQTLWQRKPRIPCASGGWTARLCAYVTAKDMILAIIARIGAWPVPPAMRGGIVPHGLPSARCRCGGPSHPLAT